MSTLFAPESINKKPGCGLYFTFFLRRRVEFHSSHSHNWKLEYQDISIMKYEVLSNMSWTFASEQNVNDSRRSITKGGGIFRHRKMLSVYFTTLTFLTNKRSILTLLLEEKMPLQLTSALSVVKIDTIVE